MEDNHTFIPPLDRPRPSIFDATLMVLIASVGLWIASLLVLMWLPEPGAARELSLNALYYLPFVVVPAVICRVRRPGISDSLRLNPLPVLPTISVIAVALMSVYAASALDGLWTMGLEALGLTAPAVDLTFGSTRELLLGIVSAAAIPAVCEELLFRGFVFAAWESRGTAFAVWISALLFALLHGNPFGLPAYLLVGAISAYMVFALDSLYAGIAYHTVYNSAILVIGYLLKDAGDPAPMSSGRLALSMAVDGLLTCGLIAVMLRTFELRRRMLGIEAIPRIREPLRRREVVALIALGIVLVGTAVAVLLGV